MALFDVLPSDLFKPLASPSRRFFADLLLHLHDRTFASAVDSPRRTDVLHEIGSYIPKWEATNGEDAGEETDRSTSVEDRARAAYQRLLSTGWLMEHKDRYIRRVDLDPDAAGLLHVLSDIERGETRTYGGAVVGVLAALESAAVNPAERSENLRNAVRAARDFLAHMRMVSVSMRKVEERIVRQESLREIFRHFFEDYVERHLIADFRTLHTKDNPFRFRAAIIRQVHSMTSSPLVCLALAEAYWRENRAPNPKLGEEAVLSDLAEIATIFESAEDHLAAIDATAARIERRVMAAARYMDRTGRRSEANLVEAMKAVSKAAGDPDVPNAFLPWSFPIGPAHIPAPRKQKPPVVSAAIREPKRDPAFEAFMRAKQEYVKLTRVTPQSLVDYIERELGRKGSFKGSDARIEGVHDFVRFQRIRELPTIFDGTIARRYALTLLDGRVRNGWIECQDFLVSRRVEGTRNAA